MVEIAEVAPERQVMREDVRVGPATCRPGKLGKEAVPGALVEGGGKDMGDKARVSGQVNRGGHRQSASVVVDRTVPP